MKYLPFLLFFVSSSLTAAPKITKVETLTLVPRNLTTFNSYVGHLQPAKRVTISSEIAGTIKIADFVSGQEVAKGEVLLTFDKSSLSITHELNLANYTLAKENYQRELSLFKQQLTTKAALTAQKTQMTVTKSQMGLSRLNLERATIHSPFDGVIGKTYTQSGEYKGKGKQLFEVIQINMVKAQINIPERDIFYAHVDKEVIVTLDANKGRQYTGLITSVSREADTKSRSFAMEVTLDNAKMELLPGMLSRVKMMTLNLKDQVLIPRHTVLQDEKGSYIYKVKNGKAIKKAVKLGVSLHDNVQILKGLKFGDSLIVTGQELITNNEPIEVKNAMKQSR